MTSNETIRKRILCKQSRQIYTPTDWSILNHASFERVQRLLANQLSTDELDRIGHLLTAYWLVYRADRLQPQARLGEQCSKPTEAQLQRMIAYLETQGITQCTSKSILQELENLAQQLRHAIDK